MRICSPSWTANIVGGKREAAKKTRPHKTVRGFENISENLLDRGADGKTSAISSRRRVVFREQILDRVGAKPDRKHGNDSGQDVELHELLACARNKREHSNEQRCHEFHQLRSRAVAEQRLRPAGKHRNGLFERQWFLRSRIDQHVAIAVEKSSLHRIV